VTVMEANCSVRQIYLGSVKQDQATDVVHLYDTSLILLCRKGD
jgi:hypothetical protein